MGKYKALFLDVGGVLLTNGWDRHSRLKAIEVFNLNPEETNQRHQLTFDTYEIGKMSLDSYLDQVVFYEPRKFSKDEFKKFMFDQSKPYEDMIKFITEFKNRHQLNVTIVSNEGKELTDYRVKTFELKKIADIFVFSCFFHLRKPDLDLYKLALEITQVEPEEVLYIDDRSLFVEIGNSIGIEGIHHTSVEKTAKILNELTWS